MLILAVDTSTNAGSLAVMRDAFVVGLVSSLSDETYSSRMFRQLEFLLRETGIALGDVDLFAVVAGPGSFTGLRVGLAAVKGWCEVYAKPVVAVSGLEATAAQAHPSELLVPVLDARRGQVYGGFYRSRPQNTAPQDTGPANSACPAARGPFDENPTPERQIVPGQIAPEPAIQGPISALERVGDEMVLAPSDFLEAVSRVANRAPGAGQPLTIRIVTPQPQVIAAALAQSNLAGSPIEEVSSILAPAVAQIAQRHARRGELLDALHLDANYIRRSDAELLWNPSIHKP